MRDDSEAISLLLQLGTGATEDQARAVLQRYKGDVNAAATSILDGSFNDQPISGPGVGSWTVTTQTQSQPTQPSLRVTNWSDADKGVLNASSDQPPPLIPAKQEVIDLTGDNDEEMAKAMQMSLETESSGPVFGPSNREDDKGHWAMVPSNVPVGTTLDDHELSRAVEASLSTSFAGGVAEVYEELPPDARIRQEEYPVALRTRYANLGYAALLLHALYHVPQVREKLMAFRAQPEPDLNDTLPSWEISEKLQKIRYVQELQRLYAFMDYTQQSYLNVDDILTSLNPESILNVQSPGVNSRGFLDSLSHYIELALNRSIGSDDPSYWYRLFTSRGGVSDAPPSPSLPLNSNYDTATFPLEVQSSHDTLFSCIAAMWSQDRPEHDQVFTQAAEVVTFKITRVSSSSGSPKPLALPTQLYLDPFLLENLSFTREKREYQGQLNREIDALVAKKKTLTNFEGKDTLRNLRSSIHYFSEIASDGGDSVRKRAHQKAAAKLKGAVAQIEAEVKSLEERTRVLKEESAVVFDVPELRKHKYELRAILMHDGLFGRSHTYSYVKGRSGKWWKTVDHTITEVTEESALSDSSGLHLGAGPYLLIYSRSTNVDGKLDKKAWPQAYINAVKEENGIFRAEIAADEQMIGTVRKLAGLDSPPRSPTPPIEVMKPEHPPTPSPSQAPVTVPDPAPAPAATAASNAASKAHSDEDIDEVMVISG